MIAYLGHQRASTSAVTSYVPSTQWMETDRADGNSILNGAVHCAYAAQGVSHCQTRMPAFRPAPPACTA